MIILDTNVISEIMKPSPCAAVRSWIVACTASELYTTSITIAEILYGIERLPSGQRKESLRTTSLEIFHGFEDRILPFDTAAAIAYSSIVDRRDRLGSPIAGFDAQIASICLTHRATLATRNVKDFQNTQINVINPWQ